MVSTEIEIFRLMEELFSAKYPIFNGYQLLYPLPISNTVLTGQGTADPFHVVLHFYGSFSSSKDYREAHNHERLLTPKSQVFANNSGLCCLRSRLDLKPGRAAPFFFWESIYFSHWRSLHPLDFDKSNPGFSFGPITTRKMLKDWSMSRERTELGKGLEHHEWLKDLGGAQPG